MSSHDPCPQLFTWNRCECLQKSSLGKSARLAPRLPQSSQSQGRVPQQVRRRQRHRSSPPAGWGPARAALGLSRRGLSARATAARPSSVRANSQVARQPPTAAVFTPAEPSESSHTGSSPLPIGPRPTIRLPISLLHELQSACLAFLSILPGKMDLARTNPRSLSLHAVSANQDIDDCAVARPVIRTQAERSIRPSRWPGYPTIRLIAPFLCPKVTPQVPFSCSPAPQPQSFHGEASFNGDFTG
ncbi:hypothetical protein K456DRAFT_42161 [Colletotrichum gloeosporioides 23]|nr:hypothetical protein K456DRAFT_42161 [Colletotrichum gloeosporioides 23]